MSSKIMEEEQKTTITIVCMLTIIIKTQADMPTIITQTPDMKHITIVLSTNPTSMASIIVGTTATQVNLRK